MGISKQALIELTSKEDISAQTLAPFKAVALRAAQEKKEDGLKQIDMMTLSSATVDHLSRRLIKRLVDKEVIRHGTSARFRAYDEELRSVLPQGSSWIMPDRVMREVINDLWKSEAGEPFNYSSQALKVNSGARTEVHGRAFTMFVQDTPAVRRYLKYFNAKSTNLIGVTYTPVFFSKETFVGRKISPTYIGNSRYGSGLDHISDLDKVGGEVLEFLASRLYEELYNQILKYKTLRTMNAYYHQHHTLNQLVVNARDAALNSVLVETNGRQKNTNADCAPAVMYDVGFRRLFLRTPNNTPVRTLTAVEVGTVVRSMTFVTQELQKNLEPIFTEVYTELRKAVPDVSNIAGLMDLMTYKNRKEKFLSVSLDYVTNQNAKGKDGVVFDKLSMSFFGEYRDNTFHEILMRDMGINMQEVFTGTLPNDIPRNAENQFVSLRQDLMQRSLKGGTTTSIQYMLSMFANTSLVQNDKYIEKAISQTVDCFNSLLRRNIWLTLL